MEKPTGLTVCMLASGSKGNAVYVSDGKTAVLFDAGLSGVEIERRMADRNLSPNDLTGIVVSHEHADHIKGVGVLSRRYRLPVYLSPKTEKAAGKSLEKLFERRYFRSGGAFSLSTLTVHPFSISHDTADPAAFTVENGDTKIGIATDLGLATGVVKERLKGCRLLILEANHDPEMLIRGPYPWPLKQRVRGRTGHLSNQDSMALLTELQHDNLRHVVLAHLSEINNTPAIAYETVSRALTRCRPRLSIAFQDETGELLTVL
jgi:phosphoribosyl 1,2-cyclic phosphodiesterase